MKLNREDVDRVVNQYPARPVSANDPLKDELTRIFGDHTFFLDDNGLTIIEPNASNGGETETAHVVELASWTDGERNKLLPHDREDTEIVIRLGKAA
jgi:hypothetical protein